MTTKLGDSSALFRAGCALTSIALASLLAGCGKEVGRVTIPSEAPATTSLQVTAGKKLSLWTSLDIGYEGKVDLRYDVSLVQDGAVVAQTTCDAVEGVTVKLRGVSVHAGGIHKLAYEGKMACELLPPSTGSATLEVAAHSSNAPGTLVVRDASLIAKE